MAESNYQEGQWFTMGISCFLLQGTQGSNILLLLPKEEILYFLCNFSLHGKKTNTKGSVQKTISENICCYMHSLTSTGPSVVPASCEAGVGGTFSLTAGCLGSVEQTGV